MNISFCLTTPQFRARSKDVTRRLGWRLLRPGNILEGIEKGQGLKKGEQVVRLGKIRVVDSRRERLDRMLTEPEYGRAEVILEGFPEMSPDQFVAMFCKHNQCDASLVITRIQFEYL